MTEFNICSRCVCDTTIPGIRFDDRGVCNFCKSHDLLLQYYPQDETDRQHLLNELVDRIKQRGKKKKYDCIVGVSGGTDSTYTLYMTKKLGLRPLAVHFDNGWDTVTAVTNIKNATSKLDIDLYTYVVDWEEFKNLQVAFLKASVPGIEVPTDVAIHGALYRAAIKEGVKYILGGQSFMTEGTVPRDWSYIDGTYVKSVHRKYGTVPLKTFPNATIYQIAYYTFIKNIKQIPLLNYIRYSKEEAREILQKELDWTYYGGHHYESVYTHFSSAWFLYRKFNIDKRKISLSGPVRMGHMLRREALEDLGHPPPIDQEIAGYCIKKLGLTQKEFDEIMALPPKTFHDYHTSYPLLQKCRFLLRMAAKLKFITPVLYEKYVG